MKKRALSLFLSAAMVLALVPGAALAAGTAAPAETRNEGGTYNGNWAVPICSYLYQDGANLVRVEYDRGQEMYNVNTGETTILRPKQVVIETYNASFQLQGSMTLEPELPLWGGFFAGEDYNFLIFGQENPSENDNTEVIRVVQYDKDWNRLGQASLRGANTYIPFDAGSLRCDEHNGYLYIHTAHEMYASGDGLHHQANLTFSVRERDMTITDSFFGVANTSAGYVSHSFNQFILVDNSGNIVTLDHGDAYPRGAVLMRYNAKAGSDKFITANGSYWNAVSESALIRSWSGSAGANTTGAQVTDLAETSTGYLSAFSDIGKGANSKISTDVTNIYLAYTSKNNFSESGTTVRQLTNFSSSSSVYGSQPLLVPTGDDGGYILWSMAEKADNGYFYSNDATQYARYSADGTISAIQTAENAPLSNCHPIEFNGQVVWYTTNDSAPTFYTLDSSGVTAIPVGGATQTTQPEQPEQPTQPEQPAQPGQSGTTTFTDVPTTHWAYPYISRAAENGWVKGVGNNQFAPNDTLTFAEFYTMVVPVFASDELAAYQAPAGSPWWQSYMYVGGKTLPAQEISFDTFYGGPGPAPDPDKRFQDSIDKRANEAISRSNAITIMWRVLEKYGLDAQVPGVEEAQAKFEADLGILPLIVDTSVPVCYAAGLISGDQNGNLNLDNTLTRAEGCVMLCNLVDYVTSH